jgi:Arc/MetJ-type ribon-helix-helix transcriptional regulator
MEEKKYTTLMVKKQLRDKIEQIRYDLRLRNYSEVINYLIKFWEQKENDKSNQNH